MLPLKAPGEGPSCLSQLMAAAGSPQYALADRPLPPASSSGIVWPSPWVLSAFSRGFSKGRVTAQGPLYTLQPHLANHIGGDPVSR